ncbi:MAG: tRNA(Met) cytidine acetyltransferase [Proteobacteria bacterium]|nr:tRNA(Met) cytidine acetyltransferase [Pseudomonadota bacterium]
MNSTITNLQDQRHRQFIVLAGDQQWAIHAAATLLKCSHSVKHVWVGDGPESIEHIEAAKAKGLLGQECDCLVFNAYSGLDVDALGACSGTVVGSGVLILLTPPMSAWPDFDDPEHKRFVVAPYDAKDVPGNFLQRLVGIIHNDEHALCIEQGHASTEDQINNVCEQLGRTPHNHKTKTTDDQKQAIAAIIKVATGHRRRPLVITSDRGRGKSSSLGMAAAELMQQGFGDICITAAYRDAIVPVFHHAHTMLQGSKLNKGNLEYQKSCLQYIAPQHLLETETSARLLLVDEAAAIPVAILEKMLKRFSRIVFASTVHGYEGTGRGFAVRFNKTLDRIAPQWRSIELKQAIRWSDGDPLESFIFHALLLNASPVDDGMLQTCKLEETRFRQVGRDELMRDEDLLSQVFGLLVGAHYRTRPYDLRCLLDCFDLDILILQQQQDVIGVALLTYEGMLDEDVAQKIWSGERWPHGHLLPEALTAHCGFKEASTQKCGRIMRIAIHPAIQGRGFGSALLQHTADHARQQHCDYIGTSFGVSRELLNFWFRQDFVPARLSFGASVSSGSQSLLLLKGLSDQGLMLEKAAHHRFARNLPYELANSLRNLDAKVADGLLQTTEDQVIDITLEDSDWNEVMAYAEGRRILDSVKVSLWRVLLSGYSTGSLIKLLDNDERILLVRHILQAHGVAEVVHEFNLKGKADLSDKIRNIVSTIVDNMSGSCLRQ